MYCDVVNVQPRFNISDEIIILNVIYIYICVCVCVCVCSCIRGCVYFTSQTKSAQTGVKTIG